MNNATEPRRANLTQLTATLWTGGDLPAHLDAAAEHLGEWAELGITHVIDNRLEWSDEDLVAGVLPHVAYLHNGTDDDGYRRPVAWFEVGVAFAEAAWAADPAAVVVAHCHMGINRGPSLAYAILLATGWNPVEALELIRTRRPVARVRYAEDALDWYLQLTGATPAEAEDARARVQAWREASPLDTVRIVRAIRAGEAA